jgi:thymidylate synthase
MDNMYTFEDEYLDLLDFILKRGEDRGDRTGTGTRAVFGQRLQIDLKQGFPIMTTKKVGLKSIISELLWFVEGSGDERRLCEILYGTRDAAKRTIWTDNANSSYWKPNAEFEGDLGRVYGVQWRHWKSLTLKESGAHVDHSGGSETHFDAKVLVQEVDQLKRVIDTLKTNPTDRRLVLTAWNPGELGSMALPPCHMFAQFFLSNKNELSCQMYQRSVDVFLGLPYNIASYAALTHMIARVIGAEVGELIMVLGDTHIYQNHIDQVKLQLSRERFDLPKLVISGEQKSIDDFKLADFSLEGYQCHEAINATMAI